MSCKNLIYSFLISIIFIITSYDVFAQDIKTEEQKTFDPYKEFDNNSFADATKKINDSTILRQHLIGVKIGYGISNVAFSQDIDHKSFSSPKNFGIYYTYCHSLWDNMPYFGFQTGFEYSEIGYIDVINTKDYDGNITSTTENKQIYQAFQLPLLSQFRTDFWKMRVFLNLGPFGYYITSTSLEEGIPETTNRVGVGIMGGGGVAFIVKPVEFHIECNYRYALSHFCNPEIYSTEHWLYTHANQLAVSFGIFFRLGSGKRN